METVSHLLLMLLLFKNSNFNKYHMIEKVKTEQKFKTDNNFFLKFEYANYHILIPLYCLKSENVLLELS